MPWGDRTGPMGEGPLTGRAMGYCAGFDVPGHLNAGRPGRGGRFGSGSGGRGRSGAGGGGGGRGWRHCFYSTGIPGWARGWAPPDAWAPVGRYPDAQPRDEKTALRAQADYLEAALADIRGRMSELESGGDE
jgi:hypothetical protein